MIQEAYIHGVSTRSVDDLVKAMGATGVSKSPSEPPGRRDRRAGERLPHPADRGRMALCLDRRHLHQGPRGRADRLHRDDNSRGRSTPTLRREVPGRGHRPFEAEAFLEGLPALPGRPRPAWRQAGVSPTEHKGLRAAASERSSTPPSSAARVHWMRNALAHASPPSSVRRCAMLTTHLRPGEGSAWPPEAPRWNNVARCAARAALKSPEERWIKHAGGRVLATAFPRDHWAQIAQRNPLQAAERRNRSDAPTSSVSPQRPRRRASRGALMLKNK